MNVLSAWSGDTLPLGGWEQVVKLVHQRVLPSPTYVGDPNNFLQVRVVRREDHSVHLEIGILEGWKVVRDTPQDAPVAPTREDRGGAQSR